MALRSRPAMVALLCTAQFVVVLDATIVAIALPAIQRDLHMATADLQWVLSAYTLAFAGFLVLAGRLADLHGRRRVFVAGLALFTAASLVCGLSRSAALLIAARTVQGGGAAGWLLGGVLTEQAGWPWVFLVNVPIGVAAIALVPLLVPETTAGGPGRRLDAAGATTITLALGLLVFGL